MGGIRAAFIFISISVTAAAPVLAQNAQNISSESEAVPGGVPSYYQQLKDQLRNRGAYLDDEAGQRERELNKKSADDAAKYWEELAKQMQAPGYSSPPSTVIDGGDGAIDCKVSSDESIQKAKSCITKSDAPAHCNLLVVNAETGYYYMLNSQGGCIDMGKAEIGRGSRTGDGASPGDGSGSNKTPPGLLLTAPYDGSAFNKETAIDLKGAEHNNGGTAGRGVVLHASGGNTRGCVGIEPKKWKTVRDMITDKGCGVFVHFDEDPACTVK